MRQSASRTNWFLLTVAALLFLLATPLLWAAAGLPGTTGGSGSQLERTMVLCYGVSAVWLGGVLTAYARRHHGAVPALSVGFVLSLLFSLAMTLERVKELGVVAS